MANVIFCVPVCGEDSRPSHITVVMKRRFAAGKGRRYKMRRRLIGERDPRTLVEMGNLAFLYMNEGRFPQAEQLLNKVLEQQSRSPGESHPDTLFTMSNLALLYRTEGKYADAEPLAARVLQARTRLLGAEHPDTLASSSILAQVYQGQRRYPEAESLFMGVLAARRMVLGEEHFSTLVSMNYLADLYRVEGKDKDAQILYSEVLERRRRVLGPDHPDTIKVLESLGRLQLERHKYAEAEPLLREALNEREKKTPDSWQRFDAQAMLGAALAGERKSEAAEPLLTSGYEGLLQREANIPQANRFIVQQAGDRIIQLYRVWGKPDKVAEWAGRLSIGTAATPRKP